MRDSIALPHPHRLPSFLNTASKKFAAFIFAVAVVLSFTTSFAVAEDNPLVSKAMNVLKTETEKLGAPMLEGGDLSFGTTKMADYPKIVDGIKIKYGATATIFAKKATDYVRVTTNVLKDGQRAVGTVLDPTKPAYAAINQGKPYYGMIDILGKKYDAGYEPIKTASGDIIGILFVGFLVE